VIKNLFILAALVVFPCHAWPEDQSQKTNLQKINLDVEETSKKLAELSSRQAELDKALQAKLSEVKKLRAKEAESKNLLSQSVDQQKKLEAEIVQADSRVKTLKGAALARLRSVYEHRTVSVLEGLISNGGRDIARNAVYLKKLEKFDQQTITNLLTLIETSRNRKQKLEGVVDQQKKLTQKLSSQKAELETGLKELQSLNDELKTQKQELEDSVANLKAQALRLETVMVTITGGLESDKAKAPKKTGAAKPPGEGGAAITPFDGPGLFRQKGSLVVPVKGQLLQKYGKQKIPDFSDLVFSKGLEYKTTVGSEVRALASGKVIHVGRMPGYGNIVILDHGERYYSLYGRLGEVRVALGDLVEKGAALATTGELDQRSRNFYFEIRRNGNPVNPQDYLKRL